jgi:hypothetical protein
MLGPGKYDDLCTEVREKTGAESVILLVFDDNNGSGFSCQMTLPILLRLPEMLRSMADQIEAERRQGAAQA